MEVNILHGGNINIEENDIKKVTKQEKNVLIKLKNGLGVYVKTEEYNKLKELWKI